MQWEHTAGLGPCQPEGGSPPNPGPSSFSGSPPLSHLLVQLTPCHPPLSSLDQAQVWPPFHPCISSQCLANRRSSINACDIVKQQ